MATQILFLFTPKIGEMIQSDFLGINISPTKAFLKMSFLFPRWDVNSLEGNMLQMGLVQPPTRKGVVLPVICTQSRLEN